MWCSICLGRIVCYSFRRIPVNSHSGYQFCGMVNSTSAFPILYIKLRLLKLILPPKLCNKYALEPDFREDNNRSKSVPHLIADRYVVTAASKLLSRQALPISKRIPLSEHVQSETGEMSIVDLGHWFPHVLFGQLFPRD